MHDHTTTTYAMLKQGNRFPRKKATLSSNIGELQHDTKHQKKINGAHLLKWLAAFCVLECVCLLYTSPSPRDSR